MQINTHTKYEYGSEKVNKRNKQYQSDVIGQKENVQPSHQRVFDERLNIYGYGNLTILK